MTPVHVLNVWANAEVKPAQKESNSGPQDYEMSPFLITTGRNLGSDILPNHFLCQQSSFQQQNLLKHCVKRRKCKHLALLHFLKCLIPYEVKISSFEFC